MQSLTLENLELPREANMFAPNYDKKDRKISGYNAPAPALDISAATVYCSQYMQTKEPEADRSYHHALRLQFILFFYFSLSVPGNLRVRDNDLCNLFSSFPTRFLTPPRVCSYRVRTGHLFWALNSVFVLRSRHFKLNIFLFYF